MPYIFVDELPEGAEEADVVTRADYDAVVGERDTTITQRDEALARIANAEQEVRDTKARYADYVLGNHSKVKKEEGKLETPKATMPITAKELFS